MKKSKSPVPAMSDDAVSAKTGRTWAAWFRLLDEAGAQKLTHKEIAALLMRGQGVPGWWSQNITVEYERARGLRERHQKSDGYTVSVSKTVAAPLRKLYAATADASQRKKWFPHGAFELSSQTKDKYFRGSWKKNARLEVGFYAKSDGKAQIALAVSKLARKADVEAERAAWKAALAKLQGMLES